MMKSRCLSSALILGTWLFGSGPLIAGPLIAASCPPLIFENGFEISRTATYNDPGISGPTDDGMNFTRIESMGLDWLDLTITLDLSTDAVASRLVEPSDELFGLRFATANEIDTMLSVYGLPSTGTIAGTGPGSVYVANFGHTFNGADLLGVGGIWPVNLTTSQLKNVIYNCSNNQTEVSQGGLNSSSTSPFSGSYLVRPKP